MRHRRLLEGGRRRDGRIFGEIKDEERRSCVSKASLYECCVAVNKAQKKQKVKRLFTRTVPICINQIWPLFMINVGRMPKSRAAAIINARYGLSSSFEEYKKRIEEELGIDQ